MNARKYYKKQLRALWLRKTTRFLQSDDRERDSSRSKPAKASKPAESSNSPPPISLVPLDILLLILDNLPLVTGASLALTCKRLHFLLGHILKFRCWQHAPDPIAINLPPHSPFWLHNERWTLISQLQDERWLACTKCFTLHPFTHFRPNQILFQDVYTRVCHLGERSGFVDACPCKKLTFGSKLRLSDELEGQRSVCPDSVHQAKRPVWHCCSGVYGKFTLRTQVTPYLKDQALILRVVYACSWPHGTSLKKIRVERHICPHVALKNDIVRLMERTGGSYPMKPTHISQWDCKTCDTNCEISAYMEKGKHITFRYEIARNLGNAKLAPDDTWFAQNVLSMDTVDEWPGPIPETKSLKLKRKVIRSMSKSGPLWESHIPVRPR